jgi:hypothetical protein
VGGYSEFANHLRKELFGLAYGEGPLVWLAQDRGGAVALDPQNNWLLNLWAHNEALLYGLQVYESDYTPKEADIPPEAAERLLRFSPPSR